MKLSCRETAHAEKIMNDNASNPNVEWKKGSFGEQEKLTLKTNIKKAVEYNAKKDETGKTARPLSANLPQGLKRIRNKIKSINEEDDEEDNGQIVIDPLELASANNSLLNALHDDEKKMLKQQETNNIIRQQLEVEKFGAINQANQMARQAGFNGLKKETIRQSVMDNSINPDRLNQTLKQEFKKEVKASKKEWSELSDNELMNLMEGVNKIKSIGGKDADKALKNMDIKEVSEQGKEKNNDLKVARTICKKTGRTEDKSTKKEKLETERRMVKDQDINRKIIQDRDRR